MVSFSDPRWNFEPMSLIIPDPSAYYALPLVPSPLANSCSGLEAQFKHHLICVKYPLTVL